MIASQPDLVALPPHVVRALHGIARELCDMPREFCRDIPEQIHWRARLARRLRAVAESRIALAPPAPPQPAPPARIEHRTVTNRRGRAVRVEVRRRSTAQMELSL